MQRLGQLGALLAPGGELGAALGVLRLEALARLLDMAQLGFVAGHLGVGRVQRPLRGVKCIPRGIVGAARRLHAQLDGAQLGILRLERIGGLGYLLRVLLALGGGIAAAQVPQQLLLELQL